MHPGRPCNCFTNKFCSRFIFHPPPIHPGDLFPRKGLASWNFTFQFSPLTTLFVPGWRIALDCLTSKAGPGEWLQSASRIGNEANGKWVGRIGVKNEALKTDSLSVRGLAIITITITSASTTIEHAWKMVNVQNYWSRLQPSKIWMKPLAPM